MIEMASPKQSAGTVSDLFMDTLEGQIYLWLPFCRSVCKVYKKKNYQGKGQFFVGVYVKCVSLLPRLKTLTVMHRGQTTESWITKQPSLCETLTSEENRIHRVIYCWSS